MADNKIYILALLVLLSAQSIVGQQTVTKDWNSEKIRGARLVPYLTLNGNPFLTDKYVIGEIEFADGEKIGNLNLRYSAFQDEVIYFNTSITAQIIIDKKSLRGFSFIDADRLLRTFRQQYYTGFLPGNRYFEVLSDGEISLLVYRKVVLQTCPVYNDLSGTPKNMEYQKSYTYFLYNHKKGYEQIRISRNSLFSKFDKPNLKLVKKILRGNKVVIKDETGFLKAWNLIKKNGIKVNF